MSMIYEHIKQQNSTCTYSKYTNNRMHKELMEHAHLWRKIYSENQCKENQLTTNYRDMYHVRNSVIKFYCKMPNEYKDVCNKVQNIFN